MPQPIHPDQLAPITTKRVAREAWLPTTCAFDGGATMDREGVVGTTSNLTSGTLHVCGGVILPANRTISTITFVSGSQAAVAPTNQWFSLIRLSDRAVLGKTADDTNVAWATFTAKTLTLATPVRPEVDTPVYLGIVVVAGTPINLSGASAIHVGSPLIAGTSTAGLTNPASLGATAGALTTGNQLGFACVA